jgi:hypothetical protein
MRSSPLVVTAFHSGQSNFIVHLVGAGNEEFLINEIGRYHGQTLMDSLPRGSYLLYVQADGAWTTHALIAAKLGRSCLFHSDC